MAGTIYMVCAVTAALCAYLLLRSHARSGYKLLLWSGLCFGGLTINNILLVVDKLVFDRIEKRVSGWKTQPVEAGIGGVA